MEDIEAANLCVPEYVGFVFAKKSRRYVSPETAAFLRKGLLGQIQAVGVFVDEPPEQVAGLLKDNIIDMAQLHGNEDEAYIRRLRELTGKPIIKAFRMEGEADLKELEDCSADYVLLDSGAGSGECFDWGRIKNVKRPYFLAGGLEPGNVAEAIQTLCPFGVDVSSGIETKGSKDREKMAAFTAAVRKEIMA